MLWVSVVLFCLLSTLPSIFSDDLTAPAACATCTALLQLFTRVAEHHPGGLSDFLDALCKTVLSSKPKWEKTCEEIVVVWGPLVIDLIEAGVGPDEACRDLLFCRNFEQCQLFPPKPKPTHHLSSVVIKERSVELAGPRSQLMGLVRKLFSAKKRIEFGTKDSGDYGFSPPNPIDDDDDGDFFSTAFYKYGTAWRGKDCDDENSGIYPGRKLSASSLNDVPPSSDFNCNGINGTDPQSGKSWKEVLCGNGESLGSRKGLIVIGDSACAHFRIPPQLLAANVTLEMFRWILPILANNFDWPFMGIYGGYREDYTGLTPGTVDSMYLRQRQRNLCNHRDYQTLCVNGADSRSSLKYGRVLTRNATDHPAVVFINLFGNDVCRQQQGFQYMTTPDEFKTNILQTLDFLETRLPKNSHVVFVSLVNGTLLFKFLANRTHPIGGGATYTRVYEFVEYQHHSSVPLSYLNCLKSGKTGLCPCWGWMNSNKTVRDLTQMRANQLCDVYPRIMQEFREKYSFKMHFVDSRAQCRRIVTEWMGMGKDPALLVEPVDGFHPSQNFIPLFVRNVYEDLSKEDPTIWGNPNPNNDLIVKHFGNQGGY